MIAQHTARLLVTLTILLAALGMQPARAAEQSEPVVTEETLQPVIEQLTQELEKHRKALGVPGMAVAVILDNKVIFMKGFGVKALGRDDPITPQTLFQIGSTSKAFTMTMVGMLVDEGKASWTDKVIDHVPDFRMYDPWVTREFMLEDLGAQRSGLQAQSLSLAAFVGFDRQQIMDAMRLIKPTNSFRSRFTYINSAFLVAAKTCENHWGQSWEASLQKRIFTPLRMSSTNATLRGLLDAPDHAMPHKIDAGTVRPQDPNLDWPYILGPAGGINSNVEDMAKWVRLNLHAGNFEGKQLVKPETMQYLHRPKTICNPAGADEQHPAAYYCEGWVYFDTKPYPIVWHNGGTSGFHTYVGMCMEKKLGLVILSNMQSISLPDELGRRFFDLALGQDGPDYAAAALENLKASWKQQEEDAPKASVPPLPHLPLDAYAGTYTNPLWGPMEVKVDGDALVAICGPGKLKLALQPFDGHVFRIILPIELTKLQYEFTTFRPDPQGRVTRVNVSLFDESGETVFTRKAAEK